jgi:hypothetical protein
MTSIKSAVQAAVVAGVASGVAHPATAAEGKDRKIISDAVMKEVVPLVVNATNAEPWFQSKVTIGAVITLIGGGYGLMLDFLDGVPPTVDSFSAQASTLLGAAVVLYGRWFPGKPLGG